MGTTRTFLNMGSGTNPLGRRERARLVGDCVLHLEEHAHPALVLLVWVSVTAPLLLVA